jgi:hypothetical protein
MCRYIASGGTAARPGSPALGDPERHNVVVRRVMLASALGLAVVIAGCGASSPTQAQMRAQKQWSAKNESVLLAAVGPPGDPWVKQDPGTLTPAQCHQIAAESTKGLATAPMPVDSLEALWKSYLQDLAKVSAACLSGRRSDQVGETRQAREALAQLIHRANTLVAEFHQLPTG